MTTFGMKTLLLTAGLGLAMTAPAIASEHEADEAMARADSIPGAAEFRQNCASCHGKEGKGDGPVAKFLNVDVPDLTTLTQRNDNEFPFLKVFHIIDGRSTLRAHGSAMMPVWGKVYRVEAGGDEQTINRMATERIVRGRILELVNYLAAIQEPAGNGGGAFLDTPAD